MKRILVIMAALSVLMAILSGCSSPDSITGQVVHSPEELAATALAEEQDISVPEALAIIQLPENITFTEFSISLRGSQIEFAGLAQSPVEELEVGAFCGDTLVETGTVDEDGEFSITTTRVDCQAGEKAYVEAHLGSVTFKSQEITIPARMFGGSSSSGGGSSSKKSSQPAGVPEFSPITMGLAVITAGLGIALINKNKA